MPRVNIKELGLTPQQANDMFSGLKPDEIGKKVAELQKNFQPKVESSEQIKQSELASSGLRSLENVRSMATLGNRIQEMIPGQLGAGEYVANKNELVDTISRLRSGAALTEDEVKFYNEQMPKLTDSQSTINAKLDILKNFLEGVSSRGNPSLTQGVQKIKENQEGSKVRSGVTSGGIKYTIE